MDSTGNAHHCCATNDWLIGWSCCQISRLCLFEQHRAALEGKTKGISFRNYKEMFQKMEETFKFCTGCNKLPEHLSEGQTLKRCVK